VGQLATCPGGDHHLSVADSEPHRVDDREVAAREVEPSEVWRGQQSSALDVIERHDRPGRGAVDESRLSPGPVRRTLRDRGTPSVGTVRPASSTVLPHPRGIAGAIGLSVQPQIPSTTSRVRGPADRTRPGSPAVLGAEQIGHSGDAVEVRHAPHGDGSHQQMAEGDDAGTERVLTSVFPRPSTPQRCRADRPVGRRCARLSTRPWSLLEHGGALTTILTTIGRSSGSFGTVCPGSVCRLTCENVLKRTVVDTLRTSGGQGVAGSNPVSPTVKQQVRGGSVLRAGPLF
jgi:hypothetical protein